MWFFYAFAFAILSSFGTVIAKNILKDSDEFSYTLFALISILPFLLLLILIIYGIPEVDAIFIRAVLASTVLDVVAMFLIARAVKLSEISLINPISAFNPVFTALISYFALGETITTKGAIGILMVVLGAYLLQITKSEKGLLSPLKALFSHQGVRYALIVSLLWAITPAFQKTAILHTFPDVPPFASFTGLVASTLVYIPLTVKFSKKPLRVLKRHFKAFLLFGLLGGFSQFFAFMAFSLTHLGYATAAFKLSILFTVVLGWLFFKERNIKERLLGSTVMLIGVVLLLT